MADIAKLPRFDPKTATGLAIDFIDTVTTLGAVRQGGVEKGAPLALRATRTRANRSAPSAARNRVRTLPVGFSRPRRRRRAGPMPLRRHGSGPRRDRPAHCRVPGYPIVDVRRGLGPHRRRVQRLDGLEHSVGRPSFRASRRHIPRSLPHYAVRCPCSMSCSRRGWRAPDGPAHGDAPGRGISP